MKKSLYLLNLCLCFVITAACQSHSKTSTAKQAPPASPQGQTNMNTGTEKSEGNSKEKNTAIKHGEANQAQTDSLKKEKTKNKKLKENEN